ncbi:hypothetical protein B0O80DRAFT_187538 [Mortierella sp. GBAus27b]|nr:hypothetical protein B0O80DRAFT_187538 [Mortierella sp. GBAus27b]
MSISLHLSLMTHHPAMPSPHPLELNEVLSQVARYIPLNNLPACALVSRTWYQAFNFAIWRTIGLNRERPDLPFAIQSHYHLVRKLHIQFVPIENHSTLRCPNLDTLDVCGSTQAQAYAALILNHPNITRLSIRCLFASSPLWSTLHGFRHLKDLTVDEVVIPEEDTDSFWQLCTRLDRLHMINQGSILRGNLSTNTFHHMKELVISGPTRNDIPVLLEFMQRCPHLRSLEWMAERWVHRQFAPKFAQAVVNGTWPDLQSLYMKPIGITREGLAKIIKGMQRIIALDVPYFQDSLPPNPLELLRPHFPHVRVLNLLSVASTVSPVAQEILSTCPSLEQLAVPAINANIVVEGKPWVCFGLRALNMGFLFDPTTIHVVQPAVFNRLSKLKRLRYLRLGGYLRMGGPGWQDEPIQPRFQESIDLRLKNGLASLSTLRSLEIFNFYDTEQRMGEQEIEWIVQHWRSLNYALGVLNTMDPDTDQALRMQLRNHGISG